MFVRESTFVGSVKSYEIARTYGGKALWTTRIYLLDRLMIDTAAPNAAAAVLPIVEGHRPEAVLLTHHHEDHSGNADVLKKRFGMPVLASSLTAHTLEQPFYLAPFQRIVWGRPQSTTVETVGEEITVGGHTLRPIEAPGHSHDMTVYLEPNRGLLFSGDLYLSSRIKFFREDENYARTKRSLENVLKLDFDGLFCGHNPKPKDGKGFLQQKLDFFLELEGTVAVLSNQGHSPEEITRRVLGKEGYTPFLTSGRLAKKHLINSILASLTSQER